MVYLTPLYFKLLDRSMYLYNWNNMLWNMLFYMNFHNFFDSLKNN